MNCVRETHKWTDCDYYITMHDITCLHHIVEEDHIHLDNNDVISVRLWVTWLQQGGMEVALKDKVDPPPPGSGVEEDSFILCVQTEYQRDRF